MQGTYSTCAYLHVWLCDKKVESLWNAFVLKVCVNVCVLNNAEVPHVVMCPVLIVYLSLRGVLFLLFSVVRCVALRL